MRVAPLLAGAAALAAALPVSAQPAAAPPGAASCSGCHARAGAVETPVPPIHGRPAEELVEAMRAYRAGERAPTIMDRIAKGFSEDETRMIAAWLADQRQD